MPTVNDQLRTKVTPHKRSSGKIPSFEFRVITYTSSRSDYGDTINLFAGPISKRFTVHRDLIRDRSKYFRELSEEEWRKIETNGKTFSESIPDTVKIYLEWAYSSTSDLVGLAEIAAGLHSAPRRLEYQWTTLHAQLMYLWCFADLLGDNECKNCVIDSLIAEQPSSHSLLNVHVIYNVWTQTKPSSKLRSWLVNAILPVLKSDSLDLFWKSWPPELIKDMLKVFIDRTDGQKELEQPQENSASEYYD